MDEDKVIVAYHGSWWGRTYKNGTESLVFWSLLKSTFGAFMALVHRIVDADQSESKYVVHCLVSHEDSQAKWMILSTEDLHRAANMFKTPKFFVTLERRRPPSSSPFNGVMKNHPLAPHGARLGSAPVAKPLPLELFAAKSMAVRQPNKAAKVFEGQTARKRYWGFDGEFGRGLNCGEENADAKDESCPS